MLGLLERDQAGGGDETARIEVERAELVIEVRVEPLASGRTRLCRCNGDHPGPDTPQARRTADDRVEDEGVDATVPRHVHEPDELAAVACADPTQAVPLDLAFPIVLQDLMAETLRMETVYSAFSNSPRHRYVTSIARSYR